MTDQTDPTPETDKPTPAAAGTEPEKQAGDSTLQAKTFTQDELNYHVRERLDKERDAMLKRLGITSIDEGKAAVAKVKELEDAQKTELQKLQDRLTAAETRAADAEQKRQKALIEAAVIAEASKPGKVAGDRLEAAYKLLDTSKVKINDSGEVEGVTDALTALLEKHPFLKAEGPKQPEKPQGTVQPTNPAGTSTDPGLASWFKPAGKSIELGRGGVVPPTGE